MLVDEYDKPILDNISDIKTAAEIREVLKDFYSILKSADGHLRFVFLTGVSKFSKAGVFSGLNHLRDLTLVDDFAEMLGYSHDELESNFGPWIEALSESQRVPQEKTLEKIRDWYNGFRFSKRETSVYNPFSTLLLFENRDYQNYWFESGTPTFLIKLIREQRLEIWNDKNLQVGPSGFSSYEIETMEALPLLIQTGYLTIAHYSEEDDLYQLDYPNREVRYSFNECLLRSYSHTQPGDIPGILVRLVNALRTSQIETFLQEMKCFFANIPYDIQEKESERYYQTIFHLVFLMLGAKVQSEVGTNKGRIDAVVTLPNEIWIFEFKLDGNAQAGLKQIIDQGYDEPFRNSGKAIHRIGVGFDQRKREIASWTAE